MSENTHPIFYCVKINLCFLVVPGHPGLTAILDISSLTTDKMNESGQRPAFREHEGKSILIIPHP